LAVGEEQNGIPLSMVSALSRLGLYPWVEAGRLSSLGRREAIEQLARLITKLPGNSWPLAKGERSPTDSSNGWVRRGLG
jgi:hypothetical protein